MVIEFLSLLVPMLLVQTSLLPYVSGPVVMLTGMLVLATLLPCNNNSNGGLKEKQQQTQLVKNEEIKRKPAFLSMHRSSVYILTTIAILAVDFPLFPRRFCKTEIGGYGWMDMGAASFIIIAGLSSTAASADSYSTGSSSKSNNSNNKSSNNNMTKVIKKCLPLLLIGLIRLATNKGLEYQEHVSEYGVHWNFFFTLCCVEACMVLWRGLLSKTPFQNIMGGASSSGSSRKYINLGLALVMMIPYQLYLTLGGGQEFIENGERTCIFDDGSSSMMCNVYVANREGILGVIGYFSLRLMSEDVARFCLWPSSFHGDDTMESKTQKKKEDDDDVSITMSDDSISSLRHQRLFLMSAILWSSHFGLVHGFDVQNSRRSTNVPFVLWALAHNISVLFTIHYVMMTRAPPPTAASDTTTSDGVIGTNSTLVSGPRMFNAVNRFGLAVFLTSNIMTGLVNLTVDTLHSSDAKALVVLSIYLGLVCGVALLLDRIFHKKKLE